jgi:hypothetical protein
MTWLLDPRAFNVLIILLFIAAAIRWAFAGNWPQAGYWASAAVLNVFVTLGVK